MDTWEQKMVEFLRHGQKERVDYFEKLRKSIFPTQLKRIQQNDKTVLKEMVLPKWMNWELLYEWANRHRVLDNPRNCILCNEENDAGIDFKEKFICDYCFLKLKNLE
ncbi:MAG: hypothetical protein ABIH20_05055 [Candidatus Diapherotrites archaeon]